jgi:ubiquinone/menaquinone biosynthesis C-methylase UbiE
MHWRVKGCIQKVLGVMPIGGRLHYLLQRRTGALREFARECSMKVDDWTLMVGHLRTAKLPLVGSRFLEIGTGWYPTFPFCLYLAGAARVETFDLNRHLKTDLTLACAIELGNMLDKIAEATGRSVEQLRASQQALCRALERGASLEDATDGTLRYRAPGDASATGLPDASIDVVFSNSVLEHVPPVDIARCFVEARRVLRPGGVTFHSVNCGDHYAYVDRSISQLNYLRFSDAQWALWNNKFLYQNRLRAADFTRMARDAGFTIEVDTSRPHPKRLAELDQVPVHPGLAARYSREQLAITSIDFIGRKDAERRIDRPLAVAIAGVTLIDVTAPPTVLEVAPMAKPHRATATSERRDRSAAEPDTRDSDNES